MNKVWVVESLSKRGLRVVHCTRTKNAAALWIRRKRVTKRFAFVLTLKTLRDANG